MHRSRHAALLMLFVALLWLATTGCDDKPAHQETGSTPPPSETEPHPADEAPDSDSPEARFLTELAELAEILDRDAPPGEVASAFEAHFDANQARIVATARALQAQRATMTPDALESFETRLAARPEAAAFTDALEAFQVRAGADYQRVEDVMLDIYRAAGIEP